MKVPLAGCCVVISQLLPFIAAVYGIRQDRFMDFHMKLRSIYFIKVTGMSLVWIAVAAVFGPLGQAQIPSPRLKPAAPELSNILTGPDARLFHSALTAAKRRQWSIVEDRRLKITDRTARNALYWLQAVEDPNASFSTLTHVVQNLQDWPRLTTITAKAEKNLFNSPVDPQRTIRWFADREPVSGEGRAALARACYESGNPDAGDAWLRKAWRQARLTRDGQKRLFGRYRSRLTADDHYARADHLIWQGPHHYSKADALRPFMTPGQSALVDARTRIARNASGINAAINRIPDELKADPGFLYERAKWRRRKRTGDYALPIYHQIQTPPVSDTGRERLWHEKKIMAYWAIGERKYPDAYKLVINHGLDRGRSFAEAEFLAGWLALTKLGQADRAITHFQALKQGVSYPVSLSRADYWLGRAHEHRQDSSADTFYKEAARFSNTYYGFLAAERLGADYHIISLPHESDPAPLEARFEADERVRVMRLFGEARERLYFSQFAFHLDDEVGSLEELTLLSRLAKSYGYMRPSVRAAKQASRFGSMLTESGYPMPDAIMNLPDEFDKPFVLAIARQESEFENNAVSHARAYGLMQMINATARATARKHRIPYSRSRLTTDIDYSARLGALYLHDLLRRYDGSYILAAVGYNAGPTRVSRWITTYGDPRKGEIDPVDWLESIPFSETRNYVQRVMENMQVYRARMNGNRARNRVYRDITLGAF